VIGPFKIGTLGNDLRAEFKAVGDTVRMKIRKIMDCFCCCYKRPNPI
jgi:hypothetical protein